VLDRIGSVLHYVRKNLWRFNARAWFGDLSSVEIDRPVFLLGTQGGGLTLVSRILRRNPAMVSVTGGHKYWNGADEMQNVMAPILPRSLRLQGREELSRFRAHGGWTYACEELFDNFRKKAKDVTKEDTERFKRVIRCVISMYGTEGQENRFIDKSQSFSLKVSYIDEMLKESNPYFILITRNPYAVCQRAVMKTNLSRVNESSEKKMDMSVQHWGNTMRSVIEDSKSLERFDIFRIEDIVERKSKEIKKICNSLDIKFRDSMMPKKRHKMPISGIKDGKWYPIRQNINDVYLENLSSKLVEKINNKYAKEVKRTGYKVKS
jgi:hypothetical protein